MKKLFGLIVLLGILFVSCGNVLHTKASDNDAVDVTLQIPAELLTSLSSRNADDTTNSNANSIEVSLFVNDQATVTKVVDLSNSENISFPNIPIGSVVKAKAILKYEGREYSGESAPAVVTDSGAQLTLVLKIRRSGSRPNPNPGRDPNNNPAENGQTIILYYDDIFLSSNPVEEGETVQTARAEFVQMGFIETTDFSIQDNKIIFTDTGLEKFLDFLASEDERNQTTYDYLLVFQKRMIGALSQTDKELLCQKLNSSDYKITHEDLVVELTNISAFEEYYSIFSQNPEETFQEETSGEIQINQSKLDFTPWNVQDGDTKKRYMTTISLESILGEKRLSDGDTIVFVLTTDYEGTENIFNNYAIKNNETDKIAQFYYQLQEDDWATLYDGDDAGLFRNNNCINFKTQEDEQYTFVMPLNRVNNVEEFRNLQLFFDAEAGTSLSSMELQCSIKYYIFPASQTAYVFGVGVNWGAGENDNPYRYEINIPLRNLQGNPLELEEGDSVSVYLQGRIRSYQNESFTNLNSSTEFFAEIYDNAEYEGSSFHALSMDKLEGDVDNPNNVKKLSMGTDGGLASDGQFVFSPISAPYVPADNTTDFSNDFRFQCHSACTDPEVLLVITDFDCISQVTKGN